MGIWGCKKCDAKFTGKAYTPLTKTRLQVTKHEQFGLSEQNLQAAEAAMAKAEVEREERRKMREEERAAKEAAELSARQAELDNQDVSSVEESEMDDTSYDLAQEETEEDQE